MKTIITDSIKSVNRIIRRKNNGGESTFGTEAITAVGIAWQIVVDKHSAEGMLPLRLINNNTAAAIVLELIIRNPGALPFVPQKSICLSTAAEILKSMNYLRANDYGISNSERIELLESFIEEYEETLRERKLYDEIMVLKEAVESLQSGEVKAPANELEICYYQRPSTLETEMVNLLSSPAEYAKPKKEDSEYSFVKAYGIVNEADYVAKTIVDNNLRLGDVEIICDTSVYAPFIQEAFAKRGIVCNFTSGVSAAEFNMIQLIKDIINWYESKCNYKDLFSVIHNPLFTITVEGDEQRASNPYLNGISYGIGWGAERYFNIEQSNYDKKHGTESEVNRVFREVELPALGELAKELDKVHTAVEAFDLIMNYANAHIRRRNQERQFTTKALQLLRKNMELVKLDFSGDGEALFEYLFNELDAMSYSVSEEENAVSVSSIYKPICLERHHIFVIGLSAKEFKISTAESPVMGDDLRIELFGNPPCGNVMLARNAIEEAERVIRETLDGAPRDSQITIISSSADVMRDGSAVAASSLFEKLKAEKGAIAKEEDRYYEITDYDTKILHDDSWSGYSVNWSNSADVIEKTFSKSTLDDFIKCPLKYHYDKDLHINKEEYSDYDPSVWLAANSRGNLIHGILEIYANTVLKGNTSVRELFDSNCTEFKDAVAKAVEDIEKECAAPNDEIKAKEVAECEELAAVYLAYLHKELHDTGWEVFSCEEEIEYGRSVLEFKESNTEFRLVFSGRIDRIDRKKGEDGEYTYRIIDYKTGSAKDMIKETKQHLIYAKYVKDKYNGEVEAFDYLFLKELVKNKKWISEISSKELKMDIITNDEKNKFYKVFENHDYKSIAVKDCNYCKYKDICLYGLA